MSLRGGGKGLEEPEIVLHGKQHYTDLSTAIVEVQVNHG